MSEATQIQLKISNFSGSIMPRHPISDKFKPMTSLPSCTVVYIQTNMEEKLIVAVCGHVSGTCTAGTVHTGDISHYRRGKRAN